jgi:hypothetical protein
MENHKLTHVQGALQRLDQALARLESAAVSADAKAVDAAAVRQGLEDKFNGLTRTHTALKETSGRVVTKLDAAIDRLSAELHD